MIVAAMRRRLLVPGTALAAAGVMAACGSEAISPQIASQPADVQRGAQLFVDRCAGCHNLDVVGAQGGAQNVKDRERVDGPNFNVRHETRENVLYAIRNGGFSGAIMPENIVVGRDAQDIAAFLSKYAGRGQ
jgi:mono/diheme cytochrome c family protein